MHSACVGGHVSLVHILLSQFPADIITAVDDQNNTPLHAAALCGELGIVWLLLKESKCDVNVRGQGGRTLLHIACLQGDVNTVRALVNEYQADFTAADDDNNTALHVAALHDNLNALCLNEYS